MLDAASKPALNHILEAVALLTRSKAVGPKKAQAIGTEIATAIGAAKTAAYYIGREYSPSQPSELASDQGQNAVHLNLTFQEWCVVETCVAFVASGLSARSRLTGKEFTPLEAATAERVADTLKIVRAYGMSSTSPQQLDSLEAKLDECKSFTRTLLDLMRFL